MANVVAEAGAFDSWTPRGPAQACQQEMLRILRGGPAGVSALQTRPSIRDRRG